MKLWESNRLAQEKLKRIWDLDFVKALMAASLTPDIARCLIYPEPIVPAHRDSSGGTNLFSDL